MKCLITGGCGFLGSNIAIEVLKQDYELVSCTGLNATSAKMNYYSINKRASQFDYLPQLNSLDGIGLH